MFGARLVWTLDSENSKQELNSVGVRPSLNPACTVSKTLADGKGKIVDTLTHTTRFILLTSNTNLFSTKVSNPVFNQYRFSWSTVKM